MWVPELLLPPNIIRMFGPKTAIWPFLLQNMLSWAHKGLAGSFGALLVGWLVVVARGVSRKTPISFFYLICKGRMDSNHDIVLTLTSLSISS